MRKRAKAKQLMRKNAVFYLVQRCERGRMSINNGYSTIGVGPDGHTVTFKCNNGFADVSQGNLKEETKSCSCASYDTNSALVCEGMYCSLLRERSTQLFLLVLHTVHTNISFRYHILSTQTFPLDTTYCPYNHFL